MGLGFAITGLVRGGTMSRIVRADERSRLPGAAFVVAGKPTPANLGAGNPRTAARPSTRYGVTVLSRTVPTVRQTSSGRKGFSR
jgi:hypothetical protein